MKLFEHFECDAIHECGGIKLRKSLCPPVFNLVDCIE